MSVALPIDRDAVVAASSPRGILIVRLGAMGDVLHALPAVAALRHAYPRARIGWIIERRWQSLLAAESPGRTPDHTQDCAPLSPARPLVDCIHPVDTRLWRSAPFTRKTLHELKTAFSNMRSLHYEVAIDFQGALKSALAGRLSGASELNGFTRPREVPASILYTRRIIASGTHVIDQNLSLAAALTGLPSSGIDFPLPHDTAAEHQCESELARMGITQFAILTPGAGWGAKQWPAARYGELAASLGKLGLRSLINAAPGEEALAATVVEHSGGAAISLACSLPHLIAFTRRAQLFIGGDTGPMHLAAALKVPVVALFGPTDPSRNGPYTANCVVIRDPRSITSYSHGNAADPGLSAIESSQVIAAATNLLGGTGKKHE